MKLFILTFGQVNFHIIPDRFDDIDMKDCLTAVLRSGDRREIPATLK